MITLLVFTDGRDHIYETIPSALAHLHGPISRRVIYDDSGDAENRDRLADAFPTFVIAHHPDGRQGFGGAIRFMWQWLAAWGESKFVFHLEDDFTFNRDVDLDAMARVLDHRPELMQLVLRRQPWNAVETEAGGIVELRPDTYVDCHDGANDWLEHGNFFSTNPCLYRRSLCSVGWPADPQSEGQFGVLLRQRSVKARFGFWGARTDDPWVTHTGRERVGTGY